MRKAFTLIELMISIMILSILMLFLYKSYTSLNRSNNLVVQEVEKISHIELIKEILFKDFTLAFNDTVIILHQNKHKDILFFETKNSLHKRINPYVAYVVKDKKLYRLESFKPFKKYPLVADSEFVTDELGEVKTFRVYKSKDATKQTYLVHLLLKDKYEIVLKTKILDL